MAVDLFAGLPNGVNPDLSIPATHAEVTTGSDTVDLVNTSRALVVGTAGNIKVTTLGGETVVMAFPAGVTPIRVTRVWLTSLTAAGITAIC